MSLQRVPLSISFTHGIDTKTDSKLFEPPWLTTLENAVFKKAKGLSKRYGFTRLGQKTSENEDITAGEALGVFGNELLMFDNTRAYSYSASNDHWIDKGAAVSLIVSSSQVLRNGDQQTNQDSAINNNVAVYAWRDTRGAPSGIRYSVIDLQTGVQYVSDVEVSATGSRPKLISLGSNIWLLYYKSGEIKIRQIAVGTPTTLGAESGLVGSVNSTGLYDVAEYDDDPACAVIAWSTDTDTIKLAYLTSDGTLGDSGNGFTDPIELSEEANNSIAVVVDGNGGNTYVAYHSDVDGTRCFARSASFVQVFAPVTLDATTSPITRNVTGAFLVDTMHWFYELENADSYHASVKTNTVTNVGVVGSAATFKRSVGLGAKAFTHNSLIYVTLVHDSTLQACYFTADHNGTIVGKQLYTVAGGLSAASGLPRVNNTATGVYKWACLEKGKLRSEGYGDTTTVFSLKGVSQVTLDFSIDSRFQSAKLGDNLHIVGGVLQAYDSQGLVEHGFHLFPENVTTSTSTSGGSIGTGTFLYKVIWEWTDAKGQVHRSAPSPAITVTHGSGSTNQTILTVPTLRLTAKTSPRSEAQIVVYRTKAGESIAYYRLSLIDSPVLNDLTADTVDFADDAADASIGSNELLYTVGGELDNDAPPPTKLVLATKKRLFVVDEQNRLWYSKEHVYGQGVGFSLALTKRVDSADGEVTALAALDGKVIVFTSRSILYFAGDGPTPSGAQDTFTAIDSTESDVGCTNPNSLVNAGEGLLFKSAKGIYMLSRSLQVGYIGAPVEAYNSLTITGAVLVKDANQVRFTNSDGNALVYDYLVGQWGVFTNYTANDAVIWKDAYCHLKSDGRVHKESAAYLDDTSPITLKVETAWIKAAGPQGYQRVYRAAVLGDFRSHHTLVASIGYDYQEGYTDSLNFNTATALNPETYGDDSPYGDDAVYGGTTDQVYQFRLTGSRQKCQAIRYKFEDSSATGESLVLNNLSLDIGMKGGLARLKTTKSL